MKIDRMMVARVMVVLLTVLIWGLFGGGNLFAVPLAAVVAFMVTGFVLGMS
jgi:hypothetical protein